MPLTLGGPSTDRSHLITFDPAIAQQVQDAIAERTKLLRQGYSLEREDEGEFLMKPPPRDPDQGLFRVLSENGDDRIVWNRKIASEVRDAYSMFKDFIKKGYKAYAARTDGCKGHRITDFDPGLSEIIFVPSTVPG